MSLSEEQAKKLWNEMYEANKVKLGIFHAADLYLDSLPEKIKDAKAEWIAIHKAPFHEFGLQSSENQWFKKYFGE